MLEITLKKEKTWKQLLNLVPLFGDFLPNLIQKIFSYKTNGGAANSSS